VDKVLSQAQMAEIKLKGGKVETMPKLVHAPGLEQIALQFAEIKREAADRHMKHNHAMMTRLDALIESVKAIKITATPQDLAPLAAAIMSMRQAHTEHEPCDYKLTGKRDRRGFIDLEHGLTFTAVRDE
jgi:hypothetical protein